jgi:lipoate synthase
VAWEECAELKQVGLELGRRWGESGPLVRSSYNADRQARELVSTTGLESTNERESRQTL